MVHAQAESVFFLEHYFTLKGFDAVHEAFITVYPE
jgi:hypothetical protein